MEALLKGKDVARALSISPAYAYRLCIDGILPSIRIGRSVRVRPSDLEAYVASNIKGSKPTDLTGKSIEQNLDKTL